MSQFKNPIIKLYLDIGCSYQGNENANIYKDIDNWNIKDCGIISMLKIEIDREKKTSKEILFKQILSPMYHKFKCSSRDYDLYKKCILKEFDGVDLLVTFNGRDFDLPIIINNLNFQKYKEHHLGYLTSRDRDLLDLCLLKNIPVKGGLKEIVKRLNIVYKINDSFNEQKICLLNFDEDINKYNNNLINKKERNESDIKVLPLLEEKLGFLYEPRSFIDKFHKNWNR